MAEVTIYLIIKMFKIKNNELNRFKTHGFSRSNFYRVYRGLKTRCENSNNKDYKHYGERGIKCEWKSFEEFKNDMFNIYQDGLTLERIDVNGNYSKENCRWATRKEQARNRTNNHTIEYMGQKKSLSEWAEFLGVNRYLIEIRLKRGWDINLAFMLPKRIYDI